MLKLNRFHIFIKKFFLKKLVLNFFAWNHLNLFAFKRKFRILYQIEVFFKMNSRATEQKKQKVGA